MDAPARANEILVIEDEAVFAKNLKQFLERAGFVVRLAATGEEGLQLIASRRPDLIVLDHQMPGMSGLDLLSLIEVVAPQVKVIMLTAHPSIETAVEAMSRGASDFMSKPVELPRLQAAIETLLAPDMDRTHAALPAKSEEAGKTGKAGKILTRMGEQLSILIGR
jgi:two-component system, NtrC family, response regulator AtoC